jgi:Protein of unknown function (DUF1214)
MFPALDKVSANAIYPINLGDELGKPLDGTNKYTLHFDSGATLYDQEGYQVANPLDRFALSSWMPLHFNSDGSLNLYFQNESPMLIRKRIGCQHRRAIQPHNAALCAEQRGADGPMESAAGRQSRGANVPAGAIAEMIVQNSRPVATIGADINGQSMVNGLDSASRPDETNGGLRAAKQEATRLPNGVK